MSENLDFYNSLELTLLKAANLISDGVNNSKSLFHTPVLSTFINNTISTRTVVLREFNAKKRILRFHTDSRSWKIEELKESNYVVVLDEPEAPLYASKPNKKIIVIITGIIGILFGIIIAIFEEVWNYINRTEGVKIIKAKKKFKENILDLIPKFFKT